MEMDVLGVCIHNYWISGLHSSSGILNTRKHNFSEKWVCFRIEVS
jgi:hypothetical protein